MRRMYIVLAVIAVVVVLGLLLYWLPPQLSQSREPRSSRPLAETHRWIGSYSGLDPLA